MYDCILQIDNIKVANGHVQNVVGSAKILNRALISNDDNNAQSEPDDADAKKV